MTREKLLAIKKAEELLTLSEDRKRTFDNTTQHGGDGRIAVRVLFGEHSYHPGANVLKQICEILSEDLEQKRAEAKVAFENL